MALDDALWHFTQDAGTSLLATGGCFPFSVIPFGMNACIAASDFIFGIDAGDRP